MEERTRKNRRLYDNFDVSPSYNYCYSIKKTIAILTRRKSYLQPYQKSYCNILTQRKSYLHLQCYFSRMASAHATYMTVIMPSLRIKTAAYATMLENFELKLKR